MTMPVDHDQPDTEPRIELHLLPDPQRHPGQGVAARDLAPGAEIACNVVGDRRYQPDGTFAIIHSNVADPQDATKRLVTLSVDTSPPIVETQRLDADTLYTCS